MNNKVQKMKGITLIALVVTIVVLLILAGVTIATLTGENGILTQVGIAKDKTDRASKIEQEQLDDVAGMMNNYEDNYNKSKGCNIPKLTTGMTPVNYNSSTKNWEKCSTEDWDWDYINQGSNTTDGSEGNVGTSKWANAMTEDGSLWVWIPRYAYKIKSGYHSATAGEIDVIFLVGTTNKDGEGNFYSKTYDMVTATSNGYMSNFVVHPAFGNDTAQGGWSNDITGFWVDKFEAGCDGTGGDPTSAIDSTIKYTSNKYYTFTSQYSNFYGVTVPDETIMKYPVFKPNVFSYSYVSVGDAYGLAKSLNVNDNPYGFSNNCDTHMMKNSEWGAVAYLTQSKYGRNGTEISINNCGLDRYNGCYVAPDGIAGYIWVTGYSGGLNDSGYDNYKSTAEYYAEYGSYFLSETNKKYKSILSIDSNYATAHTNTGQMANYSTHNNIFGDAIWETSFANNSADLSGNAYAEKSWNSDYSAYPYGVTAFLYRGGYGSNGASAGTFYFNNNTGNLNNNLGFRPCVVSPYLEIHLCLTGIASRSYLMVVSPNQFY